MVRRSARGQSLVEFAVLAGILLVILMGIEEFSRLWYANITVQNAARVGAEYGAQNYTTAEDAVGIEAAVRAEMATLFGVTLSNPSVSVLNGTDTFDQRFVSVTVIYTFQPILPVPGMASNLRITKTAIMRLNT